MEDEERGEGWKRQMENKKERPSWWKEAAMNDWRRVELKRELKRWNASNGGGASNEPGRQDSEVEELKTRHK